MSKIDIKTANETMLDGMSNLIEKAQWNELLIARCSPDLKDTSKLLSPQFVIKYKNLLNFAGFSMYVSLAFDEKKLDTDFIHRFWKYFSIAVGKDDVLLQKENLAGKPCSLGKWVEEQGLDMTHMADILTKKIPAFTMDQLDKNPYKYNASLWMVSIMMAKELSLDFIEKYMHIINFSKIFTNPQLSNQFKEDVINKFGTKGMVAGRNLILLPDGATLENKDFESVNPGRPYYGNLQRFAVSGDELADIVSKQVKPKFARAFEDCNYADNAAVMVAK